MMLAISLSTKPQVAGNRVAKGMVRRNTERQLLLDEVASGLCPPPPVAPDAIGPLPCEIATDAIGRS